MQLHISKNIDALSIAVADKMAEYINEVLQTKDRFTLVLSGGSTPKKLHEVLSSDDYKNKIDWAKVHIFFGDERFVPFTDERNNAKMAFDTLLNHVPVAAANIHIMQTENIKPQQSAIAYEEILHKYFDASAFSDELSAFSFQPSATFDLVLLGMGDDGHTLSLFPGKTEVIHETEKWCTALWLETQNMFRITLTHPVVNKSGAIFFLVSSSSKAKVLQEVLKGKFDPDTYPSQIINPANGQLHWFVDEDAAGESR